MLCDEFPAMYEVLEPGAVPARDIPVVEFRTTAHLGPAPRLEAVVVPSDQGDAWLGKFFGPQDGAAFVACTADPSHLLAVAGGVAYWVPVLAPVGFKVVSSDPVQCVHCSLETGLVILEGYSSLTALDKNGERVWLSAQLVSDGFAEVRVAKSVVVLRGYSAPAGRDVELTLDLATGMVEDGG